MLYILAVTLLLLLSLLVLKVRLRFEVDSNRRALSLCLGRSGYDMDWKRNSGRILLFGRTVRESPLKGETTPEKRPKSNKAKPRKEKTGRKRSPKQFLQLLPRASRALWRYTLGIGRGIIVEQLKADVSGGFDEPHLTGQAFGYYRAAVAAVPSVFGRVTYVPDWNGASFAASARVAIAIPLYLLLGHTLMLLARMPLMKIIRLAIGKKKGVIDGQ